MPDWYRTHSLSPEAYSDDEYRNWAQENGLYVDVAGNMDYGPPEAAVSCPATITDHDTVITCEGHHSGRQHYAEFCGAVYSWTGGASSYRSRVIIGTGSGWAEIPVTGEVLSDG